MKVKSNLLGAVLDVNTQVALFGRMYQALSTNKPWNSHSERTLVSKQCRTGVESTIRIPASQTAKTGQRFQWLQTSPPLGGAYRRPAKPSSSSNICTVVSTIPPQLPYSSTHSVFNVRTLLQPLLHLRRRHLPRRRPLLPFFFCWTSMIAAWYYKY